MTDGRREEEEGARERVPVSWTPRSAQRQVSLEREVGTQSLRNGRPSFLRGGPAWGHKRALPAKAEVVYISHGTIAASGTRILESYENVKPWGAFSSSSLSPLSELSNIKT